MRKALLVVDVQNDFYETGALPVNDASKINTVVNRTMSRGSFSGRLSYSATCTWMFLCTGGGEGGNGALIPVPA